MPPGAPGLRNTTNRFLIAVARQIGVVDVVHVCRPPVAMRVAFLIKRPTERIKMKLKRTAARQR